MHKTVMTRRDVTVFWRGLQLVTTDKTSRDFAYAIARNRNLLKSLIEDIQSTTKPLEEFEEQRVTLAREMAKKDSAGHPISTPEQGYFVPDMIEFTRRLEKIKAETGQDRRDEEVEKLLDSKEEVSVYQVDFDVLPETVRPDILEAILPMVRDPEEANA